MLFFLQLPQVSLLPPPSSIHPEVATEGFPGRLGMVHVTKMENILKKNQKCSPDYLLSNSGVSVTAWRWNSVPNSQSPPSSHSPALPHPIPCVYTKHLTLPISCPTHPAPLSIHQTVPPSPKDNPVLRPQPGMGHCRVGHLSAGMAVLVAPWWSCCHLHHASRQRGMQAAETLAGTPVAFSQ